MGPGWTLSQYIFRKTLQAHANTSAGVVSFFFWETASKQAEKMQVACAEVRTTQPVIEACSCFSQLSLDPEGKGRLEHGLKRQSIFGKLNLCTVLVPSLHRGVTGP